MVKLSDLSLKEIVPTGCKIIVGLSGGADSVALLDLLVKQGYQCFAAHCNFHLRGEESNRDLKFAHSYSNEQKTPFFHIDFQTEEYASIRHLSTEMAARELRYQWFAELKDRVKADYIAVAHHADDCIETFMINLSRGTGLRGLAGIKEKQGDIIRPLIHFTKKDILDYIQANQLQYVDDSTNFESIYTRNKFRNNILPQLEEINPAFRRNVLQTIRNLSDAESFIRIQMEEMRKKYLLPNSTNGWTISKKGILDRDDSHFILFELLKPFEFSTDTISDLLRLGHGGSGKRFYSDQYELRNERTEWEILPIQKKCLESYTIKDEFDTQTLPIHLHFTKMKAENVVIKRDNNTCYADCDKIAFPLTLRHYKSGDYFIPFGMNGRKKISDFFIDQHYSQLDKDKTWLLTSVNGEIIWLVGKRADNRCRMTDKTDWVYEITIE